MDGHFLHRIYQEGSEASAAVVAVETHTIHKLEEGIGEFPLGVDESPPVQGWCLLFAGLSSGSAPADADFQAWMWVQGLGILWSKSLLLLLGLKVLEVRSWLSRNEW